MDDKRLGAALRAVRVRHGWRQTDLAKASGVSQPSISRIERGHLDRLSITTIREVLAALDARVDLRVLWRGGELDRLLDRAHARLGEAVVRWLEGYGWALRPEISFSHYGERGVIDLLAWHGASGSLLVIELKTALLDLQALMAGIDRKRRLAAGVARSVGWQARSVSSLVVVSGGHTNRRRVTEHRQLLRSALPDDGRAARAWVRRPNRPLRGLMFWPDMPAQNARPSFGARHRVAARRVSVDPPGS